MLLSCFNTLQDYGHMILLDNSLGCYTYLELKRLWFFDQHLQRKFLQQYIKNFYDILCTRGISIWSCIFTYVLTIGMMKLWILLQQIMIIFSKYLQLNENIIYFLNVDIIIKPYYLNNDTQTNTHISKLDEDICFLTMQKVIYYFVC